MRDISLAAEDAVAPTPAPAKAGALREAGPKGTAVADGAAPIDEGADAAPGGQESEARTADSAAAPATELCIFCISTNSMCSMSSRSVTST